MSYVKISLTAVAALFVMAFIGGSSASATVLCSTTTTPCSAKWPAGTVLEFSLAPGTSSKLTYTNGEPYMTCTGSTIGDKLTNAGSSTTTPAGPIETLTWSSCTFPNITTLKGGLEVHHITGTHNGTVTTTGETKVTFQTLFFGSCVYGTTAGTHLGTLTGTTATRTDAVFAANTIVKKLIGSEAACPETSKWTAEYTLTKPANTDLYVEPS